MLYLTELGAKSPSLPFNSGRIYVLSKTGLKLLTEKQPLPDGIGLSLDANRIFWTNMGSHGAAHDGGIMSSNFDGSDLKVLLSNGAVSTPKQLAVDEAGKKIYFADREGLRVMRSNFDGSMLETLITTGDLYDASHSKDSVRWCVGVAISKIGIMFWSQRGPPRGNCGKILCLDLRSSGARPQMIIDNLPEPIALAFDDTRNILYWTDRGELPYGNTLNELPIESLDPLKVNREGHQILAQNFNNPIGIAIDSIERKGYVADMGGGIYKCDLVAGGKEAIYRDEDCCFAGVAIAKL